MLTNELMCLQTLFFTLVRVDTSVKEEIIESIIKCSVDMQQKFIHYSADLSYGH
jgi:hypothetical protein